MLYRNLAELAEFRKQAKGRIVATNGCFDVLHAGHIHSLRFAKNLGDILIVGLNSDDSVRDLKGDGRPINLQQNRVMVLSELRSVDVVTIFEGKTAVEFLTACQPHIWVKGNDYNLESIDAGEREVVERCGAEIRFIPFLPGLSTTSTVAKMRT